MRNDATVIGLVSFAHGMSHFFQLLLAPLFPFIKDELGVSYAALGFLVAVFYAISALFVWRSFYAMRIAGGRD